MATRKDELEHGHTQLPIDGDPKLHPDLQKTLERVGPGNYARATGRDFRPGGRFNPRPRRQRYAIT